MVVRFLKESAVEAIHATLAEGMRWNGAGWNTTKASRVLENATGVGLVGSKLTDYMQAFLFSLALVKEVEVETLDLKERPLVRKGSGWMGLSVTLGIDSLDVDGH